MDFALLLSLTYCLVSYLILILGLIYIKANNYPLYHWKNISTIILITICGGIGFSSGIITLVDIIHGRKH